MPTSQTGILGLGEIGATGKQGQWGAAMVPDQTATVTAPTTLQLSPMTALQGLGIPAFCTAVTLTNQTAATNSLTFWYVPSSGTYLACYSAIITSTAVLSTLTPAISFWANMGAGPGVGYKMTVNGSGTFTTTLGSLSSGVLVLNAAASQSTDSGLQVSVTNTGGTSAGYTLNLALLRLS